MSKAEGKKIGIKFTEPLDEIILISTPTIQPAITPEGIAAASSQYATSQYDTTYAPSKAFDNVLSSYWRPSTEALGQWIRIELGVARSIAGFKMYSGANYRVRGLDLYGSNDAINFSLIFQSSNLNATGWNDHNFEPTIAFKYYKWVITSKWTSYYMYIYDLQLKFVNLEFSSENEDAVIITGQEYQYVDGPDNNGPLVNKTYQVNVVRTHPTEPNSILLEFNDVNAFKNVVGDMVINYNQALGNLTGVGGAVPSFETILSPQELQEQGNPSVREYIKASLGGTITMIYINKMVPATSTEFIQASVDGTIEFKHISEINP